MALFAASPPRTHELTVKELIDELVKAKLLSQDDGFVFISKYQELPAAYSAIVSSGTVPIPQLAKITARLLGVGYSADLPRQIAPAAKRLIPADLQKKYRLVPYALRGKRLKVATDNPGTITQMSQIGGELPQEKSYQLELSLVPAGVLDKALTETSAGTDLPEVDLRNKRISSLVLNKIPRELAIKYQMVVFEAPDAKTIKVALSNPDQSGVQQVLDFIRSRNRITVEEYKTSHESLESAIDQYSQPVNRSSEKTDLQKPNQSKPDRNPQIMPKAPEFQVTSGELTLKPEGPPAQVPEEEIDRLLTSDITSTAELAEIVKTGQVPKILAAAIILAVNNRASDIHLEPQEKDLLVRYRIDGVLQEIGRMPVTLAPAIVSRIKILAKLKLDEQRVPQDGRMDVKTGKHVVDIRVATMPTVFGEKAVLRLLDKSARSFTLEELGLTGNGYDWLIKAVEEPYGVIMATGPTGSGKSTTLYALLTRLNKPQVNIITLEDPVEYEIPGINQTQIKPQIGFTFAEGLRSVLRQDPNIIMVGEIRDAETANLVTQAALTGHLVLTTLHTNDAAGAMPRLVNMGIEPFLITSAINAILAQRLVRKLCPDCKRAARVLEATLYDVKKTLEPLKIETPLKFYESAGCNKCRGTGFVGRIGIFEVMRETPALEDLVIGKASAKGIFAQAVKDGMITMKQDGLLKALKGVTSLGEVYRVTAS